MTVLMFFLTPIGRYIGIAIISAAAVFAAYIDGDLHGDARGRATVQAKWDAANKADIQRGIDAQKEAEKYIDSHPIVKRGPIARRLFPDDQWNRDKGPVQPLAPYNLLSQGRHSTNGGAGPRTQSNGPRPELLVGSVPCWKVRWAVAHLSKETLAEYEKNATPDQKSAGAKCLKENGNG